MTDFSPEGKQHFFELLKSFNSGMMVTKSLTGDFRARPMQIGGTEDGYLWFLTSIDSEKVREIEQDPNMCIALMQNNRMLSISGKGSIQRDRELVHRLFTPTWKLWFPQGADTPDLALIRFEPTWGEYWDESGIMRKLEIMLEAGKALLKGERVDEQKMGDHLKVDLHPEKGKTVEGSKITEGIAK